MSIRVGINGLGRVGRAYLRYAANSEDLDVVAVNDVADATTLARLLRRDSTFGRFDKEVAVSQDLLLVDGRKVGVTAIRSPEELPWAAHGVDVVVECTGKFRTRDAAAGHLRAGAPRVLISAPGKGVDATIVMGVNDEVLRPVRTRGHLERVLHHELRCSDGEGAATMRSGSRRAS